ncbi:Protein of unknown function [Cotesia congregata]|uniref:Uncharacterized protein n=1 Tax=Cotesia congregata TaxID=51543 RepID=A0A8J2MUI6_COTCN|nr:Protein of unknown function [Cotesia congregata]
MYRFSKSGRLFVQGTREQDDRDNVAGSSPTGGSELQAVHTKRHMSTEILGILSPSRTVAFYSPLNRSQVHTRLSIQYRTAFYRHKK